MIMLLWLSTQQMRLFLFAGRRDSDKRRIGKKKRGQKHKKKKETWKLEERQQNEERSFLLLRFVVLCKGKVYFWITTLLFFSLIFFYFVSFLLSKSFFKGASIQTHWIHLFIIRISRSRYTPDGECVIRRIKWRKWLC